MKILNQKLSTLSVILILALSFKLQAQSFTDAPEILGELDTDSINESSGLAYDADSGLLFHINDSGDGPYVYTTKRDGSEVTRFSYDDEDPKDVEDLAIGPCEAFSKERCLYVADIGDNRRKRDHVRITKIELSEFTQALAAKKKEDTLRHHKITAKDIYKLEYPDRAHDAESLLVTEEAKIYILTKEWSEPSKKIYPSKLFVFDPSNLLDRKEELQYVVSVEFSKIISDAPWWGQVPTAMDYSSERKEVSILTYSSLVIMKWDDFLAGGPRHEIRTHLMGPELPQQEAITYSPEGLIYSTEFVEEYGPANLYLWRYR